MSLKRNLYFAYGSNLWREQMKQRCPMSKMVGPAILKDYRWVISQRGFANVIPFPGAEVHGLLYQLNQEDEDSLDCYEGIRSQYYQKIPIIVWAGSIEMDCFIYLEPNIQTGRAPEEYIERLKKGFLDADLPHDYLNEYIVPFLQ